MTEEIYSLAERWLIVSIIYVISLIICIIYSCCRVDRNQISCVIFILSIIYASLFVFLNVIVIVDLLFNNEEGFEKLIKIITNFYIIFNYVDKIFGYFLFTGLIYYLESGHYSKIKKLLDYFIRTYLNIKKLSKCEIIIIISIGIPLISIILIFLIIYRDKYELGYNPLDYINVLLDCYSIFEIYTCVGFFIVQIIIDYRRQKNEKLIQRYYRYSITKIIEKTEKYFNKINNSYEVLNKDISKFEKTDPSYYKYLLNKKQKIMEKKKELEGNNNDIYNNTVIDTAINININNNNNYLESNLNKNNQLESNKKLEDEKRIQRIEVKKKRKTNRKRGRLCNMYKKV